MLTYVTEQDRKEDQPMCGTQQDHGQVHPEVKYLENLRFGKSQHHNPSKFSKCDSTEDLEDKSVRAVSHLL